MRKPISARDLNVVCKQALSDKMNGETNPHGSNQNGKSISTNNSDDGDSQRRVSEKAKLRWETDLQHKFLEAMDYLGLHKAVPKTILEFMNEDGLTRAHVASHLQKYRKHLKRLKQKAREAEMARRAMNNNFASSSYFNFASSSYINTGLNMDNLFQSQLGYGLGQSSLILNNNDYLNYIQHGRPIFDLSQTGSNLLPMGGRPGFSSVVLPLNEERRSVFGTSQVPQYGAPSDVLGLNSNIGTNYMRSNYAGISIDANGDLAGLGGARVIGNGNGSLGESFGAMNWNFNYNNMSNQGRSTSRFPSTFSPFLANEGQSQSNLIAQTDGEVPRSIFGTSQASQVPRFGQYGTTNESFGAMNWNFNNNNMSNHASSTSRFPSTFSSFLANEGQPQSNLIAQTDGGVPRSIFGTSQASQVPQYGQYGTTNDVLGVNADLSTGYMHGNYTGINTNGYGELVGLGGARVNGNVNGSLGENAGTMNWNFNNNMSNHGGSTSRFSFPFSPFFVNEDPSQSNLNAQTDGLVPVLENLTMCNDHHHDIGNTINSQFDQNQHQGHQVSAGNPELPPNDVLLERNANWSFDNHQGQGSAGNPELSNDVLLERNAISNWNFGNGNDNPNEVTLNSIAANSEMYIPTPDMNTINQEQGAADLAELPLPPIDPDWTYGDFIDYMLDDDDMN